MKTNRNAPQTAKGGESVYTITDFDREFPDDATCLDFLVRKLYPNGIYCPTCEKVTKHHRDKKRPSYACQYCAHREHPLVGTIFEGSSTSLRLWFYAMYLMASTRCGISAKQIEREIGVSYKTAWRIFNRIRSTLWQDESTMTGTVEMDEAYFGGKLRQTDRNKFKHLEGTAKMQAAIKAGMDKKTPVFGMVERAGKVVAKINPGSKNEGIMPHVQKRVLPGSMVYTDEAARYQRALPQSGYQHKRVHHAAAVYVDGDVHTNSIEGFWALTKGGIGGVYHSVSAKFLQDYLNEYAFRYNRQGLTEGRGMFDAFLGRIEKAPKAP
jgi:transposase